MAQKENEGDEEDMKLKFQLVSEICLLPNNGCTHRRHAIGTAFVDWYRLLRVEEDASVDVIRKQYLKLALQLHPDKNKHPKAEMAFKLVSEAYSCLSDKAKRQAFNLKRWKNLCIECNNRNPNQPIDRNPNPVKTSRSGSRSTSWIRKGIKELIDRFKEEVMVIEKCLRAKDSASGKESPVFTQSEHVLRRNYNKQRRVPRESPVFNPTGHQYEQRARSRVCSNQKAGQDMFWYLHSANNFNVRNNGFGRDRYDSPIFELRSDHRPMFRSKSACVRS